ncbi:hypothetical protein DYBT9275_05886 [Dyadobacter sp. CECT 9275]|uniref:FecR family protein n=1 Tax=Dyadobacter helix TaxID=2822344 RepID=A0A916NEP5_9BACT|nr:FecR domain-containing protein [Dyadobacter sp. CECT 9275]CAG5017985.1 hypothetical protein DYBT9275_05886 [Dyadobacter sp. CECT 9275]
MHSGRIDDLVEKFFRRACTDDEMEELAVWVKQNPDDAIAEVLENAWLTFTDEQPLPEGASERILQTVFSHKIRPLVTEDEERRPGRWFWPKIAAAAAVLLSVGLYWWWSGKANTTTPVAASRAEIKDTDLPPGGNKAVLTLGDGSTIVLDSAGNGSLASQGNTNITKSANGELIYIAGNKPAEAIVYNTVSTPKGGQYHIVLPDGSKVWLNAASSLRFPTAFTGTERRVDITGEVYFEIAHNPKMPFVVKTLETEITVLGTHFNVMAYPDEKAIKTTLLEGSVKVSKAGKSVMLTPGQQARISELSPAIRVLDDININKEVAWKTGFFEFEDDNLESIMRQVSRWYDVEVTYEGSMGKDHFTGRLPRNTNVSKVLKILSLSGIKYRIEGKSIIITP